MSSSSLTETINDQDQQQIESIQKILENKNDKEVQVSIGDIFVPFINLIDSQKKLVTMTGIPTFSVLEKIVEIFSGHYLLTLFM